MFYIYNIYIYIHIFHNAIIYSIIYSIYYTLVHGKCLLKVEGRGASAKCRLCLKWAMGAPDNDVVLLSLLLALNVFCTHYGASAVDFEQANFILI